jgi:hypothetical protein
MNDVQQAFSDDFRTRMVPQTKIRPKIEQKGTEGLPLFDQKIPYEERQEKAQQILPLGGTLQELSTILAGNEEGAQREQN